MAFSQHDQKVLTQQEKLKDIKTDRLYRLEIQAAAYGDLDVPPHISQQIESLYDQIEKHNQEIDRLKRLAVEGDIPVAEAEFEEIVAGAWKTPYGKLSVVGRKKIEFARLRLYITPERAKEITWKIRGELAKERAEETCLGNPQFYKESANGLRKSIIFNSYYYGMSDNFLDEDMASAIRLHPIIALDFIFEICKGPHLKRKIVKEAASHYVSWYTLLYDYIPLNEEEEVKGMLHAYLQLESPFNSEEWDAKLPDYPNV